MAVQQRKGRDGYWPAASQRERTRGEKLMRVLIVLVLLTLIGFAGYSQYREITMFPENAMVTVLSPVQRLFAGAVDGISGYFQRLALRNEIELEYNKLKAQNDLLMYDSLLSAELQERVNDLERQLGLSESQTELNPISARVIARESGNWFSTFEIDKGKNHGIDINMAVITPEGLVGRVCEVFATTSKVISIIDSSSTIAGLIESSRDQGDVRGSLGIDGEPLCRMYNLPTDTMPRPGDIVVTSGVGISFPKGLTIGTIRESTRSTEEGQYYIVVDPDADFENIQEVMVLRYQAQIEEVEDMHGDGQDDRFGFSYQNDGMDESQGLDATPIPLPGLTDGTQSTGEAGGAASTDGGDGGFLSREPGEIDPYRDGEEPLSEEEIAMRQAFLEN